METLTLEQAAVFLHLHPEELRMRAKRGLIPGAKVGKRWVFIRDDLTAYIRSLYPAQRQALRVTPNGKESLCHYASEERSGGSTSPPPTGSAYDDLLKPRSKA